MSTNGKLYVTIGHGALKKNFVARVVQDNDTIKTKTISYGVERTIDQAYKEVVIAAAKLTKEYRCELIARTKDELISNSKVAKASKPPEKVVDENPLITKFGNELSFKAMIKHAIKHHGVDRIIEVLTNAMDLASGIKKDAEKEASVISAANIKIARIIVETRQQGIHMASPTKEIEAAILWVMDNDNKPKRPGKADNNEVYELNGEKWNGKGHAPASFSAYINKNENHSLDDLRVN